MAINHYSYNRSTSHGQALFQALQQLEEGRDNFLRVVGALIQMKDGSDLTSYAVAQFGYPDIDTAEASLAELEALEGALDGIAATINQCCNRHRNGV